MKTTNHFLIFILALIGICSLTNAQVPVKVGSTPKQTMRYGMDYERLWYWTTSLSAAEKDLVSQWSVVDNDIDFIRVAMNCGYELTEGEYNLSAYTNKIIPMMQDMKDANPNIKFFASPRPLNEATNNVAWQPYPQWITGSTGSNSNFSFDWEKCAEYLVRYIELMDSYGFEISYLDVTNEWNYVTPTHVRDIAEYLEADLGSKGLTMPQIIAPSAWSYRQGANWLGAVNTTRRRNAIDITAAHNTDKTGTAEEFVAQSHDILGAEKEVWNTEVHGWKSTSNADEVLTFSFMLEAINAGFSGLTGWLAIGTRNQGHCYILNPSGTPSRNVKYFIFNKLTNTSHRGQALDIETPNELSHTTALIKDNLLTVWAINPNDNDVDISIDLTGYTSTNQITRTYWNTDSAVEGVVNSYTNSNASSIIGTVPAGSLSCFEIPLGTDTNTTSFTPDPNKTYYIDNPHHNLRLAASGTSEDAYTTSTDTTGDDVEWKFVDKGNGYWHIQRAAGGNLPRLRTDNTEFADMQATTNTGTYTYYAFTQGSSAGTHFITLPDGPSGRQRLQINNGGLVRFMTTSHDGTWESFKISEALVDTSCNWVTIANEREVMNISGTKTIRYGANDVYVTRTVTGTTTCGNAFFGDPLPGVVKQCQECVNSSVNAIRLEAEDYDGMNGIQTEASTESGENVGWINNGDWLRFDDVNLSGLSNMDARIACNFTGGTIQVRTGSATGTIIGSISISNTGGNQSWVTTSTSISNVSGNQDVYLVFTGGSGYLFNVNWIEFNNSSTASKDIIASSAVADVQIYPNPVSATTTIKNAADTVLNLYDMNGVMVFTKAISSEIEVIDISELATGIYYVKIKTKDGIFIEKIAKE